MPERMSHDAAAAPGSTFETTILEKLYTNLERILEALCRSSYAAHLRVREVMHKLALELVECVVRRPEAAAALLRDRRAEFYLPYHSVNAAIYATSAAHAMDYRGADLALVANGALLHDAGMCEIPATIFNKSAPLTVEESFFIQKHPQRGAELLAGEPEALRAIVRAHHERFRGGGYPRGTSSRFCGDERSMLVSIADAYDAMISHRAYRPARSREEAKTQLLAESGGAWSKPAVEGFLRGLARLGH